MSRERVENPVIAFARAVNGRFGVPDKDRVEADLARIRDGYQALGVTGVSLRRVVGQLSEGFYGADGAGQVGCGSWIAQVAQHVENAAHRHPATRG